MTSAVSIPEWSPHHKRLPRHALCESHVKHDGRTICLAVPEREAAAYLKARDKFARELEKIAAAHRARPRPVGDGKVVNAAGRRINPRPQDRQHPKGRMLDTFRASKRHRHNARCFTPIVGSVAYGYEITDPRPSELGWYTCRNGMTKLHEHRTKRGRKYLVAHIPGEVTCPDVRAEQAARAAESEAAS